jgi:Mg2+-importing ATPase
MSAAMPVETRSRARQLDGQPTSAAPVRLGLSAPEAELRLRRDGPNEVATRRHRSVLHDFAQLFTNPLILILLVASVVSAVLGEVANAVVVSVMVLLSVAINFRQAYRSQQAVDSLRAMVALTATVVRDGRQGEIPRRDVVAGDVVRLAAGDVVPADGTLLEANEFFVNEASLTGESLPVEKHASIDQGGGSGDAVFLGTLVMSGSATMLASATGPRTEFGRIAARLAARPPETEFERGIRRFALLITRFVVLLVLFVLLVNLALDRDPIESFLFAIALAIGLTPELLPMIMSVTLASGAVRMARRQVIVKALPAIQNVGSMDVLCSDKTGTLTEGAISLQGSVGPFGHPDAGVRELAAINSAFQTGVKSPLDAAILAAHEGPATVYAKIDEIPFDFTRRRLSVAVEDTSTGERWLITKGAPESILAVCSAYRNDDENRPLTTETMSRIKGAFDRLSEHGLRALGVAHKSLGPETTVGHDAEQGMTFVGFVTFLDPPMADAGEAIRALAADGVRVVILTGDNELVAGRVCRDIGIDPGKVVLGTEIDVLDELALGTVAERTTVFARVTPEQKNRVIRALQRRGHVVGYLGDGVNDAPSLHSADVGISVANATEVARESADLILLKHDLRVLHDGVMEGRKSFGNVMKYILMGTSSAFGNMFSMAAAAAFLPFLPMLPLQVLLNNLLYETSQVTLPTDTVDPMYVRKPKHWDIGFIQRFMLALGPISSVFDILTFVVLLRVFDATEAQFHTGWFVESLATQTLVIYVIRTSGNPLRSRPSPALIASTLGCLAIGVLLTIGPLRGTLGFVRLPVGVYLFVLGVVAIYLTLAELAKRRVYRRFTSGA